MNKNLLLQLRRQAHHLKSIVIIGNKGLTSAVQLEIERALLAHELIKIKINAIKSERQKMIAKICQQRRAETVQTIGNIAVIYRKNEQEN